MTGILLLGRNNCEFFRSDCEVLVGGQGWVFLQAGCLGGAGRLAGRAAVPCQLLVQVAGVDDVLGEDVDVVAVVVVSLDHWHPVVCLAKQPDGDIGMEEDL